MRRPRALLFDLGRVLVGYDWHASLQKLADAVGLEHPRAIVQWMLGPDGPHDPYCLGVIDDDALLESIHRRFDPDHTLDDAWIRDLWCDMFAELPGAMATIDSLRGQCRLGLISNTNRLHFEHLDRLHGLRSRFDAIALSHEVGSMKPDPALYLHVLQPLAVRAEECWFTDDLEENVAAARNMGMAAAHFEGVAVMRQQLTALGFRL